jgi:hypothetical protein
VSSRLRGDVYGHEGVNRGVTPGGSTSVTVGGQTFVVPRVTNVLLAKLGRNETSTDWNSQSRQDAPHGSWPTVFPCSIATPAAGGCA